MTTRTAKVPASFDHVPTLADLRASGAALADSEARYSPADAARLRATLANVIAHALCTDICRAAPR